MDSTSISQGIFVYEPPGFKTSKRRKKKFKPDEESSRENDVWYKSFKLIWQRIETQIQKKYEEICSIVLNNLVTHLKDKAVETMSNETIPTNILVTGTNLSDMKLLLGSLNKDIKNTVTPFVGVLWSRDCSNIKQMIRNMAQQFLPHCESEDENSDSSEENSDGEEKKSSKQKLTSSQYNMATLCAWKVTEAANTSLVLILPDFESFSSTVLADFLLVLSGYVNQLNVTLILCVATTPGVIHQTLPHSVVSRLLIQIFYTEPSLSYLNHVLEQIIFTSKCPFRLGKKTITFLTDVFLFHTLSVHRFIQGFKYCMMEHFFNKNYSRLCCLTEELDKEVKCLTHDDLESIRKLSSFQKYIESCPKEGRKSLLLDDGYTKTEILQLLKNIHERTNYFHLGINILHTVTSDLPKSPLGKHLREYYARCVSNDVGESSLYKECMTLARMQSRQELLTKTTKIINILKAEQHNSDLLDVATKMSDIKDSLVKLENVCEVGENQAMNFEDLRRTLFDLVENEIVSKCLSCPPTSLPLHEIIYFDDVVSVRKTLSASPRNVIHMALNNPHYYLECQCCELKNNDDIPNSMPDLCIVYKLHLEYGKMVNLHDWLQAFQAVLEPNDSKEVSTEIQARFTKAISELQFLGFIKPSGEDHVQRLTWGKS